MDDLLETAPCGFLTFADNGTILRINATLSFWLGYEPGELHGQSLNAVLSIGGRMFYQTHIFPLLKMHGRADEIYFSLKPKSGPPLAVLANAARQERAGVFVSDCVFLPMRQRREYEDELLQAKKAADAASQAKAKFLSMMSHELRTPMNAILGFGQLLEIGGLESRQAQYVTHILKGGRHLLELINQVLDIARIEAGHLDLSLEAVPADAVMSEAFEMTRPLAHKAGITVQLEPASPDVGRALADAVRLRQVLLNLMANGIKYNRPGGQVTLGCEPGAAEALRKTDGATVGTLRFVVRDTGRGIAPGDLGKLFSPFERLGAENSEVEGTGLGLSLCKDLTEAMGGKIGVQSVEGEGSCFWVELPLAASPVEAPAPVELEDQPAAEDAAPVAKSLLLYIEDNPSNLALVEGIVDFRPAWRLVSAATGKAGLEMARAQAPDLILLDLQLPDIPGDVVIEELRRDEQTRDIPIVMLSADATPDQMKRLLKLGARDYLTKPIGVQRFLDVVDALLKKT